MGERVGDVVNGGGGGALTDVISIWVVSFIVVVNLFLYTMKRQKTCNYNVSTTLYRCVLFIQSTISILLKLDNSQLSNTNNGNIDFLQTNERTSCFCTDLLSGYLVVQYYESILARTIST